LIIHLVFLRSFEAIAVMKIIVAEDDPVSCERLKSTLSKMGHEVQAFPNGGEAWAAFKTSKARLIISDWMMPEMDGLEFCRAVRKTTGVDYVYFILVTALRTEGADYDRAVQAGVDDFLVKPLDEISIWRRLFVAERILNYTIQIKQLKDLIPICMYCKKIRNDSDYWQNIENYIHEHTGSDFSHGICPDCYDRYSTEQS